MEVFEVDSFLSFTLAIILLFVGKGLTQKSEFLRAYQADVFFDDQAEHCRLASDVVPTGHVPHGVINQE